MNHDYMYHYFENVQKWNCCETLREQKDQTSLPPPLALLHSNNNQNKNINAHIVGTLLVAKVSVRSGGGAQGGADQDVAGRGALAASCRQLSPMPPASQEI